MSKTSIRLTIIPSGGDDGPLAVSDFLKQVDALRRLVSFAPGGAKVDAKVINLSMNSPAHIELDVLDTKTGDKADLESFFHDVYNVVEKAATPQHMPREVFDTLRDIASVVGRGVNAALISTDYDKILIDISARQRIESVFGADYTREGTIDGMLEAINIHGKVNNCALYPIVGPSRVACRFEEALFQKVRPALGRYVLVEGMLKYRWRERHPYEAQIANLSILPSWDEQPKFADILGFAPQATRGEPSEDFAKALRSGW